MDMLRITDLHKRFGDKEVLRGLNLTVPEHSIYGFIGKNGAGKTTTMKTILGLLKADSGEIIVGDERVVYGQTSTNQYIGYLPDVAFLNNGVVEIKGRLSDIKTKYRRRKLFDIRLRRSKDIYAIAFDCDCNRSNLLCNQHSNL